MATTLAVYIMGFTPQQLEKNILVQMVRAADNMLQSKNPAFKQAMQQASADKAKMNINNQLFVPTMHTPQTMQTTLGGWLKNDEVAFRPVLDDNFFVNGLRDPQGRENFVLFYFHRA